MVGAGLDDGDLLVIDRSLNPENGKIAVCLVDGEFTVKRIKIFQFSYWKCCSIHVSIYLLH